MTEINEPGEGHSPAAWTGVIIILLGLAVGTLFYFLDVPVGVWIGAALVPIGLIVGLALSKAGYGVKGPKFVPKAHV